MFSLRTKGRRYSSTGTLTVSSGSASECSVISVPKSRPRILIDGIDVTPEPLYIDIEDVFGNEYRQPDVSVDTISRRKTGTVSRATSVKEILDSHSAECMFPQKQAENGGLDLHKSEQKPNYEDIWHRKKLDVEDKKVTDHAVPDKIVIRMRETLTFFLLDVPSTVAERDLEEGQRIVEDNELYNYLTRGEGQNRYTRDTEVQTMWTVKKSKATLAPMCAMKDNFAMASTYDLYKSLGNY